LVQQRGVYLPGRRALWMTLQNIYIVGVCHISGGSWGSLERFCDEFSGWARYYMAEAETLPVTAVNSILKPIGSLQNQLHNALNITTNLITKEVKRLNDSSGEPFQYGSEHGILWRVVHHLSAAFTDNPAHGSSGERVVYTWLHALAIETVHRISNIKTRTKMWNRIQKYVQEGCGGLVEMIPEEIPLPLWPSQDPTVPHSSPSEHEEKSVKESIQGIENPQFIIEDQLPDVGHALDSVGVKGVEHNHRGILAWLLQVVDAIYALKNSCKAHSSPMLLIVGPSSSDQEKLLDFAAKYIDQEILTSNSISESLKMADLQN
ncbi:unnamed protein product, partial [Meganyctiphanes norvegica]